MNRGDSYEYQMEKHFVFTEEGQVVFLKIRDFASRVLKESGAIMAVNLLDAPGIVGRSSWSLMACVDRLVELGELVEVPTTSEWSTAWQHKIYVKRPFYQRTYD